MTPEEKINAIHDMVIEIRADLSARSEICEFKHNHVDEKIITLHKVIKGNGAKGLEEKHHELNTEFIRFKTEVVAYATAGSVIGGGVITFISTFFVK